MLKKLFDEGYYPNMQAQKKLRTPEEWQFWFRCMLDEDRRYLTDEQYKKCLKLLHE